MLCLEHVYVRWSLSVCGGCVCVRERWSLSLCVCERERWSLSVCVCVGVCVCVAGSSVADVI